MIDTLAQRLKEQRALRQLSQKEVAGLLGVSPSIISAYETGERTPSVENILSLSYLYKCSTDYLLGKTNEKPDTSYIDVSGLSKDEVKSIRCIINGLCKPDRGRFSV